MRPGLVFIVLFAVLVTMYLLLIDSLGSLSTFILQVALILLVLIGALRFRYTRQRNRWLFFDEDRKANNDELTSSKNGNSSNKSNEPSGH